MKNTELVEMPKGLFETLKQLLPQASLAVPLGQAANILVAMEASKIVEEKEEEKED